MPPSPPPTTLRIESPGWVGLAPLGARRSAPHDPRYASPPHPLTTDAVYPTASLIITAPEYLPSAAPTAIMAPADTQPNPRHPLPPFRRNGRYETRLARLSAFGCGRPLARPWPALRIATRSRGPILRRLCTPPDRLPLRYGLRASPVGLRSAASAAFFATSEPTPPQPRPGRSRSAAVLNGGLHGGRGCDGQGGPCPP